MHSYAKYSEGVAPDYYLPLIREFMAWDALCPHSGYIIRDKLGVFGICHQPSPLHWSRQIEWPWAILETELRPYHTCLDVGGSWSVFKFPLANRTDKVACLDLDDEAVRKGQETIDLLKYNHKIKFFQADCRKMPFNDDSFDRVFHLSTLEHMPEGHLDALKETMRVLRPGGIAMVSMDLSLEGPVEGFYVGYKDLQEILTCFRLPTIPRANTVGAKMNKEGATIAVVLMRLVKR